MRHLSQKESGFVAKHTPGPWQEACDIETGAWYVIDSQDMGDGTCIIARCGHNAEANARLIAAAPQLLEAAEAILNEPTVLTITGEQLAALRAAVAAAKG